MNNIETRIDAAVARHGTSVIYRILTDPELLPYLIDQDGNQWVRYDLASYVIEEPFQTCLLYLADTGEVTKDQLPEWSTARGSLGNRYMNVLAWEVNSAVVWLASSLDFAGRTVTRLLDEFSRAFLAIWPENKWLEHARMVISDILDGYEATND